MIARTVLGVFATMAMVCAAADQPRYTMIDLGTLGGEASRATGINNRGQVVGSASLPNWEGHTFLWEQGHMTDLGTPGINSGALAINGAGQIVGTGTNANAQPYAALWDHGATINLTPNAGPSRAVAINERGQVLGWTETPGWSGPFLWDNGTLTNLTINTSGSRPYAVHGINARGQVVGVYAYVNSATTPECRRMLCASAFLWDKGTVIDLGSLGGVFTEATGINDRGQVVGGSTDAAGVQHGFLWENGVMTDLGTMGGHSYATAINNQGQVVGEYFGSDFRLHAFVWDRGTVTDLGALAGFYSSAAAINEKGQVVGYSSVGPTTVTPSHAVLWDPQ
ncbi:MAG TPA: hypothetical protein VN442_15955 [Bryobacteraceae bacterium]|nr:hypothetical protein [Bryobacteraceae bacterium]